MLWIDLVVSRSKQPTNYKIYARLHIFVSTTQVEDSEERLTVVSGAEVREIKGNLSIYIIHLCLPIL